MLRNKKRLETQPIKIGIKAIHTIPILHLHHQSPNNFTPQDSLFHPPHNFLFTYQSYPIKLHPGNPYEFTETAPHCVGCHLGKFCTKLISHHVKCPALSPPVLRISETNQYMTRLQPNIKPNILLYTFSLYCMQNQKSKRKTLRYPVKRVEPISMTSHL